MSVTVIQGNDEYLMERAAHDEASSLLVDRIITANFNGFSYDDELQSIEYENMCYILKNCNDVLDLRNSDFCFIHVMNTGITVDPKKANKIINIDGVKNNKKDVIAWILKEGERFNIDLSRVAGALFVNSGNRLRRISSEIQKIRTLVNDGEVVSPDLAKSVLCFSAELTPKNVVESIQHGKTSLALSFYDRLQESGDETGWILSYIHNFVVQLLRIKMMNRLSIKNHSNVLSLNQFALDNYLIPHIDKWTIEELKTSAQNLSAIDLANRSGSFTSGLLLELEIARLSEIANRSLNQSKQGN